MNDRRKASASSKNDPSEITEVPVGVLHSHEKATFDAMAHQQVADAVAKQGKGELGKLMLQGMTWEVGVDGIRA